MIEGRKLDVMVVIVSWSYLCECRKVDVIFCDCRQGLNCDGRTVDIMVVAVCWS